VCQVMGMINLCLIGCTMGLSSANVLHTCKVWTKYSPNSLDMRDQNIEILFPLNKQLLTYHFMYTSIFQYRPSNIYTYYMIYGIK